MIQREDTKSLLAKSFLELSQKKSIEKISILDITQNCSMKRGTFYYHFVDKRDLIKWIYLNETSYTAEKYTGIEPQSITIARLLKITKKNYNFYIKALNDKTDNNLHEELVRSKIERTSEYLKRKLKTDNLSKEMVFAVRYHVYAMVDTMEEWLQTGMKEDEMELAEMITACMPDIIKVCYDVVSSGED